MSIVLITGATGFVGSHLIKVLQKNNCEVYGTYINCPEVSDMTNKKFFELDIRDSLSVDKIVREIMPDIIFNLAAISNVSVSWEKSKLTFETNCIGTINLLNAIKNYSPNTSFINIGSSEEYGVPVISPTNEEHVTNPITPYGLSKLAAGTFSKQYSEKYGLNAIHIRAFNHIGPGQPEGFVASDFARQIAEIEYKSSLPIIKVGNLSAERDFLDVRDVVNAYWLISQSAKHGHVYNVCSGKAIKISSILDGLIKQSNMEINIQIDYERYRDIEVPKIQGDNTKLINHTGWYNKISLNETLRDIVNYWRNKVQHQ